MFNFDGAFTFADALSVSLVSITVVFIVLILIALIVSLLGKLLQEAKPVAVETKATINANTNAVARTTNVVNLGEIMNDEHKRIATLVATIAANENDEDKKYRVVSVKEI